jgi:hypothetical protein
MDKVDKYGMYYKLWCEVVRDLFLFSFNLAHLHQFINIFTSGMCSRKNFFGKALRRILGTIKNLNLDTPLII